MSLRAFVTALALLLQVCCSAGQQPAPRNVDLTASDGTKLKATYFPAAKPGPGLLLLHQCNRDRKMWDNLAPQLAASGINVMTLDFRGFGESEGTAAFKLPPQEGQKLVDEKWPGDVDLAYQYLISQPGVNKTVIGAGGASCGVNQSIQLARRHAEVKSLVLLSGTTNRNGRLFLKSANQLPLFGSAADDDAGAVEEMEWILSTSPNPGNAFQHYANGGHGIEMFAPHPELTKLIVNWFDTTLIKTSGHAPANPNPQFRRDNVMSVLDEPGGTAKAADQLAKAREKDPKAVIFSQTLVNLLGYEHLQAGDNNGAIEIFNLNVSAFPKSPNTYDSLADAYLAAGQNDLARQNAKTALQLLESDTTDPEARRQGIRDSATQKLKQLNADTNAKNQ
jgi:dienelactone hydrolase